jgi:hypothetical protein
MITQIPILRTPVIAALVAGTHRTSTSCVEPSSAVDRGDKPRDDSSAWGETAGAMPPHPSCFEPTP